MRRPPLRDEGRVAARSGATFPARSAAQRGLSIGFVHDLTTLPEVLELRYEFEAAKYIVDSGPRVTRLPVSQ